MSEHSYFAFVLIPFDHDFDDVFNLGIKAAAEAVGVHAQRLDDQIFHEGMLDRIYRQIEASDIVIADMSSKNSNVFSLRPLRTLRHCVKFFSHAIRKEIV